MGSISLLLLSGTCLKEHWAWIYAIFFSIAPFCMSTWNNRNWSDYALVVCESEAKTQRTIICKICSLVDKTLQQAHLIFCSQKLPGWKWASPAAPLSPGETLPSSPWPHPQLLPCEDQAEGHTGEKLMRPWWSEVSSFTSHKKKKSRFKCQLYEADYWLSGYEPIYQTVSWC